MKVLSNHVLSCIALIILPVACLIDCDDVLKDKNSFNGKCNNKWSNLKPLIKPTQKEVGYAWIQRKIESDFDSENSAQGEIDDSPTPAVIGPDNFFYIVDDHHTLCALDYSGFSSVTVALDVICDKRSMSMDAFWADMKSSKLVYLAAHPKNSPNSLPVAINASDLPQKFSFTKSNMVFSDDPWRSMAGYSRKVESAPDAPSCSSSDSKYCERCMYRGCVDGSQPSGPGVAYFEFQWGYFMLDATFYSTDIWPSTSQWSSFYNSYSKLKSYVDLSEYNTDEWLDSASLTVSLCRGTNTKSYYVPEYISGENEHLPGYVEGYVKLEDDPECANMVCSR